MLIELGRWQYAGYIQDDFKVSQTLTLGFGLRYQQAKPWHENLGRLAMFDIVKGAIVVPDKSVSQVSPLFPKSYVNVISASQAGLPSETLMRTDLNDFSPRVSLAWRPIKNTVVRAGYGMFYDPVPFNIMATSSPFQLAEFPHTNPVDNPDVIFPRVYPDRSSDTTYSSVALPAAINPGLRTPRSQQYNTTVEHEHWGTGFRLSYTGTAQRQGTYSYNYNAPVPDDRLYIDKPRPFPQYPDISYRTNGAGHQYHGLTAAVKRSMAKGLQFQLAWTLQKDRYDLARWDSPENPYDRSREVGAAPDIPTNRIQANWVWELPFGRGKRFGGNMNKFANLLVGGWMLSGVHDYHSGNFLTPYWSGPDPTGSFYTDSSSPAWVTLRPDQIGDPNLPSDQRSITRWFDAGAFAAPKPGQFGTAKKGVIHGPASTIFNAGVQKHFVYKEGGPRVVLEMTFKNMFNHPNWSNPSTNISDTGGVGHIWWAGGQGDDYGERAGRLGLRVEW
jgi:hypothetical protein